MEENTEHSQNAAARLAKMFGCNANKYLALNGQDYNLQRGFCISEPPGWS